LDPQTKGLQILFELPKQMGTNVICASKVKEQNSKHNIGRIVCFNFIFKALGPSLVPAHIFLIFNPV
jgi:hypothetical protein